MSGLRAAEIDRLFEPLERHEKLGLAVSGGPDSLALMLLAARWAERPGRPELFVYTVDHGLRAEAAAEAAMVVREAGALGLRARCLRWEGEKPLTGVQAAARVARYRLMAEAMRSDGVALLATAHHSADQAETVLMRLAHGSGIEGLRGMDVRSVVEGCQVVRPLLGLHPQVLRGVVSDAGLAPANDPSNGDENYERVRWRLMLPALEGMGITLERLGTFARRMADASELVRSEAEKSYPKLATPLDATRLKLDAGRFGAQNPLVAATILDRALGLVAGDRRPAPLGPIELLARRLQQPTSLKGITLHGCVVSSNGEAILIEKEKPRRATIKKAAQKSA